MPGEHGNDVPDELPGCFRENLGLDDHEGSEAVADAAPQSEDCCHEDNDRTKTCNDDDTSAKFHAGKRKNLQSYRHRSQLATSH